MRESECIFTLSFYMLESQFVGGLSNDIGFTETLASQ